MDIETENMGVDIRGDNKRILSVQLLDEDGCQVYCYGKENDLEKAKEVLRHFIEQNRQFVGYNIKNFDIPLVKEFLGVGIPSSQIIDIGEMEQMNHIRRKIGKTFPTLEESCVCLGIACTHKDIVNGRAAKLRKDTTIIDKARVGASKLLNEKGWSLGFCLEYALKKIAGGTAILEIYNEYAESSFNQNSNFYKYAVGDVYAERELYEKLRTMINNSQVTDGQS